VESDEEAPYLLNGGALVATTGPAICRALYLDLVKRCLVNTIYEDPPISVYERSGQSPAFDMNARVTGRDWPSKAHTMIGLTRLTNIQTLAESVFKHRVQGDFVETGVWRGGATIFMRALLKAYGILDRKVWVVDSFCGLPGRMLTSSKSYTSPELRELRKSMYKNDAESVERALDDLAEGTSHEEVMMNFARYDLLDQQVRFLPGWFQDTLPQAPISNLALIRLDGDLYDSTYQALQWLYPKVSIGGYVVVDDYNTFSECRQAVGDYLGSLNMTVDMVAVDDEAIFWKKLTQVQEARRSVTVP
jgi:Macrocin-O-methyltransferase (TylF)